MFQVRLNFEIFFYHIRLQKRRENVENVWRIRSKMHEFQVTLEAVLRTKLVPHDPTAAVLRDFIVLSFDKLF